METCDENKMQLAASKLTDAIGKGYNFLLTNRFS